VLDSKLGAGIVYNPTVGHMIIRVYDGLLWIMHLYCTSCKNMPPGMLKNVSCCIYSNNRVQKKLQISHDYYIHVKLLKNVLFLILLLLLLSSSSSPPPTTTTSLRYDIENKVNQNLAVLAYCPDTLPSVLFCLQNKVAEDVKYGDIMYILMAIICRRDH